MVWRVANGVKKTGVGDQGSGWRGYRRFGGDIFLSGLLLPAV